MTKLMLNWLMQLLCKLLLLLECKDTPPHVKAAVKSILSQNIILIKKFWFYGCLSGIKQKGIYSLMHHGLPSRQLFVRCGAPEQGGFNTREIVATGGLIFPFI